MADKNKKQRTLTQSWSSIGVKGNDEKEKKLNRKYVPPQQYSTHQVTVDLTQDTDDELDDDQDPSSEPFELEVPLLQSRKYLKPGESIMSSHTSFHGNGSAAVSPAPRGAVAPDTISQSSWVLSANTLGSIPLKEASDGSRAAGQLSQDMGANTLGNTQQAETVGGSGAEGQWSRVGAANSLGNTQHAETIKGSGVEDKSRLGLGPNVLGNTQNTETNRSLGIAGQPSQGVGSNIFGNNQQAETRGGSGVEGKPSGWASPNTLGTTQLAGTSGGSGVKGQSRQDMGPNVQGNIPQEQSNTWSRAAHHANALPAGSTVGSSPYLTASHSSFKSAVVQASTCSISSTSLEYSGGFPTASQVTSRTASGSDVRNVSHKRPDALIGSVSRLSMKHANSVPHNSVGGNGLSCGAATSSSQRALVTEGIHVTQCSLPTTVLDLTIGTAGSSDRECIGEAMCSSSARSMQRTSSLPQAMTPATLSTSPAMPTCRPGSLLGTEALVQPYAREACIAESICSTSSRSVQQTSTFPQATTLGIRSTSEAVATRAQPTGASSQCLLSRTFTGPDVGTPASSERVWPAKALGNTGGGSMQRTSSLPQATIPDNRSTSVAAAASVSHTDASSQCLLSRTFSSPATATPGSSERLWPAEALDMTRDGFVKRTSNLPQATLSFTIPRSTAIAVNSETLLAAEALERIYVAEAVCSSSGRSAPHKSGSLQTSGSGTLSSLTAMAVEATSLVGAEASVAASGKCEEVIVLEHALERISLGSGSGQRAEVHSFFKPREGQVYSTSSTSTSGDRNLAKSKGAAADQSAVPTKGRKKKSDTQKSIATADGGPGEKPKPKRAPKVPINAESAGVKAASTSERTEGSGGPVQSTLGINADESQPGSANKPKTKRAPKGTAEAESPGVKIAPSSEFTQGPAGLSLSMLMAHITGTAAGSPLAMPPVRLFIFDLETTGTSARFDVITEIAVHDLAGQKTWTTLVNIEGRKLSAKVIEITGITEADLRADGVPDLATALQGAMAFITSAAAQTAATPVLVAHNGYRFDFPILVRECIRTCTPLPGWWLYLDTLATATRYNVPKGSRSQASVRAFFGLPPSESAHRAGDDVKGLGELFLELAKQVALGNDGEVKKQELGCLAAVQQAVEFEEQDANMLGPQPLLGSSAGPAHCLTITEFVAARLAGSVCTARNDPHNPSKISMIDVYLDLQIWSRARLQLYGMTPTGDIASGPHRQLGPFRSVIPSPFPINPAYTPSEWMPEVTPKGHPEDSAAASTLSMDGTRQRVAPSFGGLTSVRNYAVAAEAVSRAEVGMPSGLSENGQLGGSVLPTNACSSRLEVQGSALHTAASSDVIGGLRLPSQTGLGAICSIGSRGSGDRTAAEQASDRQHGSKYCSVPGLDVTGASSSGTQGRVAAEQQNDWQDGSRQRSGVEASSSADSSNGTSRVAAEQSSDRQIRPAMPLGPCSSMVHFTIMLNGVTIKEPINKKFAYGDCGLKPQWNLKLGEGARTQGSQLRALNCHLDALVEWVTGRKPAQNWRTLRGLRASLKATHRVTSERTVVWELHTTLLTPSGETLPINLARAQLEGSGQGVLGPKPEGSVSGTGLGLSLEGDAIDTLTMAFRAKLKCTSLASETSTVDAVLPLSSAQAHNVASLTGHLFESRPCDAVLEVKGVWSSADGRAGVKLNLQRLILHPGSKPTSNKPAIKKGKPFYKKK